MKRNCETKRTQLCSNSLIDCARTHRTRAPNQGEKFRTRRWLDVAKANFLASRQVILKFRVSRANVDGKCAHL